MRGWKKNWNPYEDSELEEACLDRKRKNLAKLIPLRSFQHLMTFLTPRPEFQETFMNYFARHKDPISALRVACLHPTNHYKIKYYVNDVPSAKLQELLSMDAIVRNPPLRLCERFAEKEDFSTARNLAALIQDPEDKKKIDLSLDRMERERDALLGLHSLFISD